VKPHSSHRIGMLATFASRSPRHSDSPFVGSQRPKGELNCRSKCWLIWSERRKLNDFNFFVLLYNGGRSGNLLSKINGRRVLMAVMKLL
jgi:hypothetical protein